ncbi:PREDICTED: uncharacterized protein LOC108374490 [Rhagoletis zephyria]|uniref:uncharacterized protein LOC108374490 n=1 Tax=Rhagoletis zephyria TaxID=28612 RepID=UPI0008119E14|nr:PREDICTED: uncharacterized protein LOC108374490 [Rhagoletis zephyria]XP_017485951.1 PREDICTED: uncharacterized protein LOC108374490 [Rhagoletis zephyria]
MLSGWYCRSMANQQATPADETDPNVDEDSGSDDDSHEQQRTQSALGIGGGSGNGGGNSSGATNAVDYKTQYRYLKRKLKFLIYENEFFQDALRSNQRRLLKVSRDRAFLLDRLLQYEKPENTSSESDETDSSEDEASKEAKKRKLEQNATANGGGTSTGSTRGRKKKLQQVPPNEISQTLKQHTERVQQPQQVAVSDVEKPRQIQMTAAEVERHLQSRQNVMEFVQDRAPATVPTEMFSNEPSLDSESNDHIVDGSSPTHVAAEECVQMEYAN